MFKHFDLGSVLVIVVTFILFGIAVFTTGFTHALFLESGVFLVSVKLIVMAYKNSVHMTKIEDDLSEIKEMIKNSSEQCER